MKIAYNASAVLANNSLLRNDNRLSDSLAKLSSGLKIVNAKDNPSGLAMARRMNAQIEGVAVATQNASDAISVIEIADGALSEVHDIMQRINELSIKACNEIINNDDRALIQEEVAALKKEITRIAQTTEFNGQKILDGSFDLRGYTNNVNAKVTSYSDYVKTGYYEIDQLEAEFDDKGNIVPGSVVTSIPLGSGFPADAKVSAADGQVITITGGKGFEMKLELRNNDPNTWLRPDPANPGLYLPPLLPPPPYSPFTDPILGSVTLKIDVVGFGSMDMQVGANEGQQMDIRIHKLSLENMGISNIDLSTELGARDALSKMGKAVTYISTARSHLGAYQNRLEHTISNLDITSENMTAAYSRIMDVDMAEEMTRYTTLQVLSQASTSMLAQANERPAQVLQLLQ